MKREFFDLHRTLTTEYYQAVRNVTCTGVKIPSQVDFDRAKTFRKGESDNGDESESGLQPEGGDDRYKVIMILLRSHRPSVESGSKSAREPSHPMSAAGQKATGVRVP